MFSSLSQRIAIGTVQFGAAYGIANQTGQVGCGDAEAILSLARNAGCDTLDTAAVYGDSEIRLGNIGVDSWNVVSKLPGIPVDVADVQSWLLKGLRRSLDRLKISSLHGLLLHRPANLLQEHGMDLYVALQRCKAEGFVSKIGVSVYDPEELDTLCAHFDFDLIQAPFNILDRRMKTSGWLTRLREKDVEIHTRSAFLQGLLLMNRAVRPPKFDRWRLVFEFWDRWLAERGTSPLQACLGYVLAQPEISRVVVGVDQPRHLTEILSALAGGVQDVPEELSSDDVDLINPSKWNEL